jgi:hypothetical protein
VLDGNPLELLSALVRDLLTETYLILWMVFCIVAFATASHVLAVCVTLWAGFHFRRIGPAAEVSVVTATAGLIGLFIVMFTANFTARFVASAELAMILFGYLILTAALTYCPVANAFFHRAITEQSQS